MFGARHVYKPISTQLESDNENGFNNGREVKTSTQITETIQKQAVKVVIALQLFIKLNHPDLFDNLIVKTAELIPLVKEISDEEKTELLTTYYRIDTSIPEQRSLEYKNRFTQLKKLVCDQELFTNLNFIKNSIIKEIFDTINFSSLPTFEILVRAFFKVSNSIETKTNEEKNSTEATNLLKFYYDQQILRQENEYSVEGYLCKDRMFENLDNAIFKMIQQDKVSLVQDLLKHRTLLVAYFLDNRDDTKLVEKLSLSTARVINIYASGPLDAHNINAAAANYYTECVTSNAALSADSIGKRIIKSVAAITIGLLVCTLILTMAWLIAHFWAGIFLVNLSWKIQASIGAGAIFSLAICGFFSHHWRRGKGCLDSEINQSVKTITQDIRQIANNILPT